MVTWSRWKVPSGAAPVLEGACKEVVQPLRAFPGPPASFEGLGGGP